VRGAVFPEFEGMEAGDRSEHLAGVRRAVIKIGSSVLTTEGGDISEDAFDTLAAQIAALKAGGVEPVVVSSGAIAAGMKKLKLQRVPSDVSLKQAIAACGQSSLMWYYEQAFSRYGERVAQVLLTRDGLSVRKRFLTARKAMLALLRMGVIPIVNENDTVAVEEIVLGDNDTLAAYVTSLVSADLLLMLTDRDGFYDRDPDRWPDAEVIRVVEEIDEAIELSAGDTAGRATTGGMKTKIGAAKIVSAFGVPTVIANGRRPGVIGDVFSGRPVGTLFLPSREKLRGRKQWIAYALTPAGRLVLDAGAVRAIVAGGKSLLPSGIKDVEGSFGVGELVSCVDEEGREVARGLCSYGSDEIRRIAGRNSSHIEEILGYRYGDEVIHRDDLVVLVRQ